MNARPHSRSNTLWRSSTASWFAFLSTVLGQERHTNPYPAIIAVRNLIWGLHHGRSSFIYVESHCMPSFHVLPKHEPASPAQCCILTNSRNLLLCLDKDTLLMRHWPGRTGSNPQCPKTQEHKRGVQTPQSLVVDLR